MASCPLMWSPNSPCNGSISRVRMHQPGQDGRAGHLWKGLMWHVQLGTVRCDDVERSCNVVYTVIRHWASQ